MDNSFNKNALAHNINIQHMNMVDQMTRPCVLHRPKISRDGDQWCALLGDDLQIGVSGFGDSPEKAMLAFDKAWYENIKEDSDV